MWAKFSFTGTCICSVITDNSLFLKFTSGLTQAKSDTKSILYMDNWANPHISSFLKRL